MTLNASIHSNAPAAWDSDILDILDYLDHLIHLDEFEELEEIEESVVIPRIEKKHKMSSLHRSSEYNNNLTTFLKISFI